MCCVCFVNADVVYMPTPLHPLFNAFREEVTGFDGLGELCAVYINFVNQRPAQVNDHDRRAPFPMVHHLSFCGDDAVVIAFSLLLTPHTSFLPCLLFTSLSTLCVDAGADEFDDAIEAALKAAATTTEAKPAIPGGYIDGETLQEANALRYEEEAAAYASADVSYVEPEQARDGGAYVDGETLQEAREAADTVGELAETPEGGNGKAFSTYCSTQAVTSKRSA